MTEGKDYSNLVFHIAHIRFTDPVLDFSFPFQPVKDLCTYLTLRALCDTCPSLSFCGWLFQRVKLSGTDAVFLLAFIPSLPFFVSAFPHHSPLPRFLCTEWFIIWMRERLRIKEGQWVGSNLHFIEQKGAGEGSSVLREGLSMGDCRMVWKQKWAVAKQAGNHGCITYIVS